MVGIIVILVGVFYVAIGRGGELAYEQADHAPLDLGPVSATDVALLRPPTALWGYNMQVTDEALDHIARALRDRDILIASLQRQLNDTSRGMPGVAPTPGDSLSGATGLTRAARWDEVIPARDEAATRLDEPAPALDEPTAAFGEATTALDGPSAETDVIDAAGPATIDLTATETGEPAAATEQPRRFVPKHERPRRSRRTEPPPTPTPAPETTGTADTTDTTETAETPEPGETAAAAALPNKADKTDKTDKIDEDSEEESW